MPVANAGGSPAAPPKELTQMIERSHAALLAAVLAASLLSSACVPLIVAGAAGTARVATDRRSVGAQADDTAIELNIGQHASARFGDRAHISTTSYNGIVLLSGEVPDQASRDYMTEYARSVARVRSVQNELVVAPPSELGSRSNDTYLTSVVKTRFLEGKDTFSPTQVKVVTDRRVVYLMGLVRRNEAEAASRIAASTSGVERVVKVFEYLD
jgi:osmotically-inducible protein OsmY